MKPISVQLYSLREEAKADWRGMLKAVADIGYVGIETAGLYDQKPQDFKKVIDDLGLQVMAMHAGFPDPRNMTAVVEAAQVFGCKYFVCPGVWGNYYQTAQGIKRIGTMLQAAAELLEANGLKLVYHNHEHEMAVVDGERVLDRLFAAAPSMLAEIDTYWAASFGEIDPVGIVKQFAKKAPLLHIKDGVYQRQPRSHVACGKGKMDIPSVINAADPKVLEWLVVELDRCDTDMLTAVRESYQYLVGNKLAQGRK